MAFFGGNGIPHAICLENKPLSIKRKSIYNSVFFENEIPPLSLDNGKMNFIVEECEVYEVIFSYN